MIEMGLISTLKNKAKAEIQAMKSDREFRNDPAVVHQRLLNEKQNVREEIARVKERQSFEQDKKELQELKNSTGLRGKIRSGLSAIRNHLDSVKARNDHGSVNVRNTVGPGMHQGNFDLPGSRGMHDTNPRGAKSLIMQGPGSSSGGGVFAGGKPARPKREKKGKTIIIKL